MTRLLFVLPQREYGGLHRLVEFLTPHLLARGIRPQALVPEATVVPERFSPNVEVRTSRVLTNPPGLHRPLHLGRHVLSARAHASRIHAELEATPDLVHVFGFTDLLGPGVAQRAGAPWVRSANSSIIPSWADHYARWAMGRADGTLFEGSVLRDRYQPRHDRGPCAVFYPAWGPAEDGKQGDARRAQLDIPDDAFVVGTWSNVTRQKGLETFIRYASQLTEQDPRIHFLVAGRVPIGHDGYLQRIREQVSDEPRLDKRFHFAVDGQLDRTSVFRTIDVLAQTSLYEGVATSTVEAMAAEVPVVAHNVGSVSDLVRSGKTGMLLTPQDDQVFVEAVLRLRRDPAFSAAIGAAGSELVRELCTGQRLIDAYLGVYAQVLASR